MSESDDPESTIPWPGFVDILSTVIIVFVFFMMMTSVIIFVMSQQDRKRAVTDAVQQAKSQLTQQKGGAAAMQEINDLKMEKDKLEQQIVVLTQLKTVVSQSNEQSFARNGDDISITFGDMGSTLKTETADFLKKQLPFSGRIAITAFVPDGQNFNSIKEIALNRALNVRNVMLQNGVKNDHIDLKIVTEKPTDDKHPTGPQYGNVSIHFTH